MPYSFTCSQEVGKGLLSALPLYPSGPQLICSWAIRTPASHAFGSNTGAGGKLLPVLAIGILASLPSAFYSFKSFSSLFDHGIPSLRSICTEHLSQGGTTIILAVPWGHCCMSLCQSPFPDFYRKAVVLNTKLVTASFASVNCVDTNSVSSYTQCTMPSRVLFISDSKTYFYKGLYTWSRIVWGPRCHIC